ncbi:MAG: RNA polymerase sigma factor RpoH [Alphaproteobacteria bacterium]|nr:RNA polymerase sigma factor RpoH [Alphaproteobacteria bacterium]
MNLSSSALPALRGEGNLAIYLREIRKFPMLDANEEYILAKAWKEYGDIEAAHKLVTSHLRLVARVAMGYRGYGLPISELIAEGNLGMMQAVKRFDPDRGFRLSTYSLWWIKAAMHEYILRSWSLVKIGTTAAQKKLFFNLRRLKRDMRAMDDGDLSPEQVTRIAKQLVVGEDEVLSMNGRLLGGDQSLNAPMSSDGQSGEWQDWLVDEHENQEIKLGDEQENKRRQKLLARAMQGLNPREREIIIARRLSDNPSTLEELSQKHSISRERIRQIEVRAFEKLQESIKREALKEEPTHTSNLPR